MESVKIRKIEQRLLHVKLCVTSAALCALLMAVSIAVQAQQYSGTIGTVTDAQGAAVPGADVTLTSAATGAVYKTTTSDQGVYSLAQVPVGVYDLLAKKAGFKEYAAKGVEVHTSTTTNLNPKLDIGSVSEVMTVEATDVQVETSQASVGEVIEGTQVRELPLNGENFIGLVTLSPGVSQANSFNSRDKGLLGGSDFSVNGNPYTNNLFLVDGVNNNDVGSNRTILVYPSTDAIAEFKMVRNSYGPEYGQASGAIISITTKSGENKFHGGLFYAGRNDKLDANDWYSNHQPNPVKSELRRNDWGYHIGGPVIKNKLFFFWGQEWDREVRGNPVSACVPTLAEQAGDFSQDFSGQRPPARAKRVARWLRINAERASRRPGWGLWAARFTLPIFPRHCRRRATRSSWLTLTLPDLCWPSFIRRPTALCPGATIGSIPSGFRRPGANSTGAPITM